VVIGTKHAALDLEQQPPCRRSSKKPPEVVDSRLDTQPGNTASLTFYDDRFFNANDRFNRYIRINPTKYVTNAAHKLGLLIGGQRRPELFGNELKRTGWVIPVSG
jgi:hypothetical protein